MLVIPTPAANGLLIVEGWNRKRLGALFHYE